MKQFENYEGKLFPERSGRLIATKDNPGDVKIGRSGKKSQKQRESNKLLIFTYTVISNKRVLYDNQKAIQYVV